MRRIRKAPVLEEVSLLRAEIAILQDENKRLRARARKTHEGERPLGRNDSCVVVKITYAPAVGRSYNVESVISSAAVRQGRERTLLANVCEAVKKVSEELVCQLSEDVGAWGERTEGRMVSPGSQNGLRVQNFRFDAEDGSSLVLNDAVLHIDSTTRITATEKLEQQVTYQTELQRAVNIGALTVEEASDLLAASMSPNPLRLTVEEWERAAQEAHTTTATQALQARVDSGEVSATRAVEIMHLIPVRPEVEALMREASLLSSLPRPQLTQQVLRDIGAIPDNLPDYPDNG
jgi:hypothetical protein